MIAFGAGVTLTLFAVSAAIWYVYRRVSVLDAFG